MAIIRYYRCRSPFAQLKSAPVLRRGKGRGNEDKDEHRENWAVKEREHRHTKCSHFSVGLNKLDEMGEIGNRKI